MECTIILNIQNTSQPQGTEHVDRFVLYAFIHSLSINWIRSSAFEMYSGTKNYSNKGYF